MFFAELEAEFLEFELLDFAGAGEGEAIHEEDVFGNLVAGNLATAELADVLGGHLSSLVEDDEGTDFLTVFLGRHGSDLDVFDSGHLIEEFLDFARIDVLAATDDHVLDAAGDLVKALLVLDAEVAGVEESVLVNDFGGGLRVLVVAFMTLNPRQHISP